MLQFLQSFNHTEFVILVLIFVFFGMLLRPWTLDAVLAHVPQLRHEMSRMACASLHERLCQAVRDGSDLEIVEAQTASNILNRR